MTICPKCGFENPQPEATECPKCGLVYAKFLNAQRNERQHVSAEQALHNSLKQAMAADEEDSSSFTDFETQKDASSYPLIDNLVLLLVGLACALLIFTVLEIKFVWRLLTEMNASFKLFSQSDRLLIMFSIGFLGILQVALCLAIGGILKLNKDIADNTRVTRNYLADLVQRKR